MNIWPTSTQVEQASKILLARWIRELPSPDNSGETEILESIIKRFNSLGGWNPTLSKQIGFKT